MEFAIPGFIKQFCTPNALLTLKEYLLDYASPQVKAKGNQLLAQELSKLPEDETKRQLTSRLAAIESGQRDLLF